MEKYLKLIEEMTLDANPDDAILEITKYLKKVKEIENYLVIVIRKENKKKRDFILNKIFDKITEKWEKKSINTEKEIASFLPMLTIIDNELIKFGQRIFGYRENAKFVLLLESKLEPYMKRANAGMAVVGIFWVINNEFLLHREMCIRREEREKGSEMVDSRFSHIKQWEMHEKDYPLADFATYPRGRILYDARRNDYIIYADKCIEMEQIAKIAELCNIKKYVVAHDEHYRCDKCMQGEEI
ncbi:MAG: hypothetical protein J6B29_06365 [Clostridia bacterium]|nr:hypothetical protein [Clostridia bacterium]